MSNLSKSIVVTGIRPTGDLHLGNYFGSIKQLLNLQKCYRTYFFIADLHSLTTHPDTSELSRKSLELMATMLACGVDTNKAVVYLQSDLPQILELYYYLNSLSFLGELEKTPTFKEKARKQPENINISLLTYPVLMAADILIHRANLVPIGKDQQAHLELCRDLAQRFNNRYGQVFTMPKEYREVQAELISIRSLDGMGKMSKSESNNATIYLTDSDDLIYKKIMKAKTDSEQNGQSEAVNNLFQLLNLTASKELYEKFQQDRLAQVLLYSELKEALATSLIKLISPIRQKCLELLADKSYINKVLKQGAERARDSAQKTIDIIRGMIKFSN